MNVCVYFPWQSAQALLPTNEAPSTCGAITTARSGVAQEIRNDAATIGAMAEAATKIDLRQPMRTQENVYAGMGTSNDNGELLQRGEAKGQTIYD
jgi:hypothetical protein